MHGSAFEDMSFPMLKITNGGDGLEEDVDWCIPIFVETS
jgi:hypothetical protein